MATYSQMVLTTQGQALYAKVQTGTMLTFTRMQIGSGQLATTLTSALTSGTSYSSLSVAAIPRAMASGDTVVIGVGSTSQAVTLSAAAAANATTLEVNSFTANANYPSGAIVTDVTDAASLTALITPIDYFDINSETTSGSTANVRGIYQNTNLTTDTYTCEIGLFAQDPTAGEILYAYANAGTLGDTIPSNTAGPFSRQFQVSSAVGNATNVTANIPSTVYVPQTSVGTANGVASLDANKNVVEMEPIVSDLIGSTSVVLSGGVATKDGSVATQLDVTAATVYFSGGTRVAFAASAASQYLTSTASTTYYLDYNLDGTTSWGTAHSTQTGYVPICSVTTDSSGNVSTVSDVRPTTVELFHGAKAVDGSKLVNLPLPTALAVTDADNAFSAKQTFNAGLDLPAGQIGTVEGTLEAGSGGEINATTLGGNPPGYYLPATAEAASAAELADYNGGHTIKATWTGSAIEFEVDSSANEPVQQAVNATNATTANNANNLGGQPPSYYATASSIPANPMSAFNGGANVQSGWVNLTFSSNVAYVTFPTAFSTTPVAFAGANQNAAGGSAVLPSVFNVSTTGFSIYLADSTDNVLWLAVGN